MIIQLEQSLQVKMASKNTVQRWWNICDPYSQDFCPCWWQCGKANVKISANLYSNVILIGKPLNGLDGKVQDMEIGMPNQPITINAKMVIGKSTETGESGDGKTKKSSSWMPQIVQPLAGVTFDCYNAQGAFNWYRYPQMNLVFGNRRYYGVWYLYGSRTLYQ